MNLRRHVAESPDVNLTPLIDVVFLLLIFFMVSTTFKHNSELKIELPQASAEKAKQQKKPLTIKISSDGRYFVDGREVVNKRLTTLKRALRDAMKGRGKNTTVIIETDKRATHEMFIRAMDAAKQLGLTKISIPVEPAGNQKAK